MDQRRHRARLSQGSQHKAQPLLAGVQDMAVDSGQRWRWIIRAAGNITDQQHVVVRDGLRHAKDAGLDACLRWRAEIDTGAYAIGEQRRLVGRADPMQAVAAQQRVPAGAPIVDRDVPTDVAHVVCAL